MLALIRARREALSTRRDQAIHQYNDAEQQLQLLQRNIDAMVGGLQELDALLAHDAAPAEPFDNDLDDVTNNNDVGVG